MSLTQIHDERWVPPAHGYRIWSNRIYLGAGDDLWDRCATDLMRWEIKARSGFVLTPQDEVAVGDRPKLEARLGPMSINEPIEVVDVLRTSHRVGFAYKTCQGHPVSGEEAFLIARAGTAIFLEIRSLTAPSDHRGWRAVFPLLLMAQKITRRRYAKALAIEPG